MSSSVSKLLSFTICSCLLWITTSALRGQRDLAGATDIRLALGKLNILGSILIIGAHPDDENTAVLAYFARGRLVSTAYLSATRGEGGQNLIGPEQGDSLGIIRTQELLAARKIDGGEQLFTRAIDFGFSKSAEETLARWGRERILADMVWIIRRFRPDVVVLQFTGMPRDGHGHHRSSAILGKEAFAAAGDPFRFPEHSQYVQPWQARRLLYNPYLCLPEERPRALELDTGEFNPLLGRSYAEIAGMSRSMHRSQGMGAPERRGSWKTYLLPEAGSAAVKDVFEGIDITWNRIPGGSAVGRTLSQALASFEPEHPEKTITVLLQARPLIAAIKDPWAEKKLDELDKTIGLCAGLWLEAAADRSNVVPGELLQVTVTALNRSHFPLMLEDISLSGVKTRDVSGPLGYNQPNTHRVSIRIAADQPLSQPFWLQEPKQGEAYSIRNQRLIGVPDSPPVFRVRFHLRAGTADIFLERPVLYRYVDPTQGELTRPLVVVPPVSVNLPETVFLFPHQSPKAVEVQVKANVPHAAGEVRLRLEPGWKSEPLAREFRLSERGHQQDLTFTVIPPSAECRSRFEVVVIVDGREISSGMMTLISHPHIPPQTVFLPAEARLVRANVQVVARKIGYVMGAGDEMPQALRQLGCDVTLLGPDDLARRNLAEFDAIVTGVRAYNVRTDLAGNQPRLLDYVRNGGTLLVQYNVAGEGLPDLGPYPLRVGRDRVSVETAPVQFIDPGDDLLTKPNRITQHDFEGWVQERGLYFAAEWDLRYRTVIESHDPSEKPHPGGMLMVRYGRGMYIFSAYSWFRQLPAGVPGAYRIFANMLSAR